MANFADPAPSEAGFFYFGEETVTNFRHRLAAIALGAALILLLACGGDAAPAATDPPIAPGPTATPAPAVAPTAAPAPTAPSVAATKPQPAPTALPVATAPPAPTSTPVPPTPIPLFPYTATGTDGAEVVFESAPERIVAFDGAAVEMLFAIGEGHRVIATHSYVTYPPETESITKVGDAFNMDIEAVVGLDPDLVFVFFPRFSEDLARTGLEVLYIETVSDDFGKIPQYINMWGGITGNPEAAEQVSSAFEARVETIRAALEGVESGPSVYQHGSGWWTPGNNTLMQAVFELLKLDNIADFDGYQQISPEVVVAMDPDLIIGDPDGVSGEPALAELGAVKEGRIINLTSGTLAVAGPRFVEGVEELARLVYPEIFE